MNLKSRIIIPILVILLLFSAVLSQTSAVEMLFKSKKSSKDKQESKKIIGAWLPYWDTAKVNRAFTRNKKTMNEMSPYWYYVLPNARLRPTSKFNLRQVREAKKAGVKVIPMISNHYDGALISKIIRNRTLRRRHIRILVNMAVKRRVHGVELDYEGLLQKDRKVYAAFVKELARALHRKKKLLSVTVQAKVKEPGHSGSTKAQSWKTIGRYADRVRIMAYDYHWKTSPPGAIAPISWFKRIARLAKKTIPAKKAMMGIGTYGYNWYGDGRAKPITLHQARLIAKRNKKRLRRDKKTGEVYLRLKPGRPGIWIQDSGSLRQKLKIVKKYDLGGVFFWRMGNEDAKHWRVVRQELR